MPDQTDEIISHTISILRVAAGLRRDAVELLKDLQAELIATIDRYAPDSLRGRRLRELLKQTDESIAAAYRNVLVNQDDGLRAVAELEGKFAIKLINGAIGVPLISVAIPEKLLEALVDKEVIFGHKSKDWWQVQSDDLRMKFAGAMRQGVLQGETVDQLVQRVKGTGKDGAGGLMQTKRRQAEALVRSSVISVSNEARMRTYEELDDIVGAIQWMSTLDAKTTPICRSLSGLKWKQGTFEPIGHDKKYPGPTAHWNCRSTQIPVLKSWEELSGKKLPSLGDKTVEARMKQILRKEGWSEEKLAKVKANARASMDGPVAADITMDQWMAGKSASFLDATLGKGKAELFRAGKIGMKDLTDQTGRELTLAELRAKYE